MLIKFIFIFLFLSTNNLKDWLYFNNNFYEIKKNKFSLLIKNEYNMNIFLLKKYI